MDRIRFKKNSKGVSLIEVMIALTILSTLILPGLMFILYYSKGGSTIGDKFEILNSLEEKIETVLAMPFDDIPIGLSTDVIIESGNGKKLDLKTTKIFKNNVRFECFAEILPVNFSAIEDYSTRQIQKATVEKGLKKITITAKWGKDKRDQIIQLIVYKANI